MTLTIIAHIFNEAYLLPWWIRHHLPIADHAIIFDYASTDASRAILRELAPGWDVRPSRNADFDAVECDREVMDAEREVDGWKIVLNVTEFLVGDVRAAMTGTRQTFRSRIMVDAHPDRVPDRNHPLVTQYRDGHYDETMRPGRLLHCAPCGEYPVGRHIPGWTTDAAEVWWYGWAPWTPETRARKLQIQTRIPSHDREAQRGWHHCIDEAQLERWYLDHRGRLA